LDGSSPDKAGVVQLLLYGQQLSRLTAMTTQQLTVRDGQVFVRFGGSDIHIPEPLAGLLQTFARVGPATAASADPPPATGCSPA
jgi:hypothetical protein